MKAGRYLLQLIRKVLGIPKVLERIDALALKTDELIKQVDNLQYDRSFNWGTSVFQTLERKGCLEGEFSQEMIDAIILMQSRFSQEKHALGYVLKLQNRALFSNRWLILNDTGENYFDIKGVKITGCLDNENLKWFDSMFPRTLLIWAFFNDNHNGKLVETLDACMSHGVCSGYCDGIFDVTVKSGDLVIDAGAWIGDFSAYAAYKGAMVYSFEPTPSTYELLKKTAQLNEGNILPYNYALDERKGTVTLNIVEGISAANSLVWGGKNSESVKAVSLDEFVEENNIRRVDFIKADIEGAERNFLKGAKNVLKKYAPRLSIRTYHLTDDPEVLENLILEANPNYKIVQLRTVLFAMVID